MAHSGAAVLLADVLLRACGDLCRAWAVLNSFARIFGCLCLIKSVDLAVRLPQHLPPGPSRVLLALWVLAALGVTVGVRRRIGLGLLVALSVGIFVLTSMALYNHHVALIIAIALILAAFDEAEQPTLLRVQLTIVYAFAAVTKLNAAYLSGAVLESTLATRGLWQVLRLDTVGVPLLPVLAAASIVIEAGLAVGLWWPTTRRATAVAGVAFHASMVPAMAYGFVSVIRLVVFSGLMLALYLPFFESRVAAPAAVQVDASGRSTVTSSPR